MSSFWITSYSSLFTPALPPHDLVMCIRILRTDTQCIRTLHLRRGIAILCNLHCRLHNMPPRRMANTIETKTNEKKMKTTLPSPNSHVHCKRRTCFFFAVVAALEWMQWLLVSFRACMHIILSFVVGGDDSDGGLGSHAQLKSSLWRTSCSVRPVFFSAQARSVELCASSAPTIVVIRHRRSSVTHRNRQLLTV